MQNRVDVFAVVKILRNKLTLHSKSSYPAKRRRPDTENPTEVIPQRIDSFCTEGVLVSSCLTIKNPNIEQEPIRVEIESRVRQESLEL